MRWRSSILYIPPTTFALPLPLLTSPLTLLSLTGWQQAVTPDSLPTQQREGHCICVCLGVYTYILYICVRVCRSACARVMCVCAASRENIQPKIKTHLSASSGCVCVFVFVRPYFVLAFMSVCATVCSELCLRRGSLLWMVTNGTEEGWGREGLSASCREISGF